MTSDPIPAPATDPPPASGPPGPPTRPLPGECGCWCQFDNPGIVSNSPAAGKGTYTFDPVVSIFCAAIDDTVCTSSVSYEWKVGGTALYSIAAGTDKTQNLVVNVTKSGTLELSLTITVKCSNGTKDFDCASNVTETFNVTAPELYPVFRGDRTQGQVTFNPKCDCINEISKPAIRGINARGPRYTFFIPKVRTVCAGGLGCEVKNVAYYWAAKYKGFIFQISKVGNKSKILVGDVKGAGILSLSVTVTVTCSDGTTRSVTSTQTFKVVGK